MSNRNGDKARHNRLRKEKIRRRAVVAALREGTAAKEKPGKSPRPAAK